MNLVSFTSDIVANANWSLIVTLFSGIGIGSVLSVLLSYHLNKRREEEIKKREAGIAVVDFLSEWVKSAYLSNHSNRAYWKLQSLYWKTILRLDRKLLDVLLPRLANTETAVGTNEIIVKCRQILLGLKKSDLKANELNNWLPRKKNKQ